MEEKIGRNDPCPCGSALKYKRCHYNRIFTHCSEKFRISIKRNALTYRAFRIVFHATKNENKAALIISFPYHQDNKGLLSNVTFPKNKKHLKKLSLVPGGKVTSHKIKYSHWIDGNVHFSQDKKIYTFKKESSDALTQNIGHIFTINLKGINGFQYSDDNKKYSQKEIDLDFDLGDTKKDSIKFTGWWYNSDVVHPSTRQFKKIYQFKQDNGATNLCFALQPPKSSPLSNMILFLCARLGFMTKERGSHLLFIGGFDKKEKSKDIFNDLHFLAMLYPVRNYNKLKQTIGSTDYPVEPKLTIS
jgi:hypothetical protein